MIMGSAGHVKCGVNPAFAILGLSSGGWTRGPAELEARAERGRGGISPSKDADGGDARRETGGRWMAATKHL